MEARTRWWRLESPHLEELNNHGQVAVFRYNSVRLRREKGSVRDTLNLQMADDSELSIQHQASVAIPPRPCPCPARARALQPSSHPCLAQLASELTAPASKRGPRRPVWLQGYGLSCTSSTASARV